MKTTTAPAGVRPARQSDRLAPRHFLEPLEVRQFLSAAVANIDATAGNTAASPSAKRLYLVGNSLTDGVNYTALAQLLGTDGGAVSLGRQTGPGFPLAANYDLNSGYITSGIDPTSPNTYDPYGNYQTAFANHAWDYLSLQTNERHLTSEIYNGRNQAEVPVSIQFMTALAAHSPNAQVFIYQRPVRRNDVTAELASTGQTNNYSGQYLTTYHDNAQTGIEFYSRSYFQQLMPLLTTAQDANSTTASTPNVKIIPAGEAWYNLDQAIKSGSFNGTGITDIKNFYADQSHPTGIGAYTLGLTFYSALTGADPRGTAVPSRYLSLDSRLSNSTVKTIIQNAVYAAMTSSAFSGYLTTLGAPTGPVSPDPDPTDPTPTPDPTGSGTIRVTAFNDADVDGRFTDGDSLLRYISVYLDTNGNGSYDSGEQVARTHGNGRVYFSDVPVGSYAVRSIVPGGDVVTASLLISNAVVQNGKTASLVLGLVARTTAVAVVGSGTGNIRGYVISDVNRNGIFDSGETTVAGRKVWIDLNNNGAQESWEPATTSRTNGRYVFAALPARTYAVREAVPDGQTETSPNAPAGTEITLLEGRARTINFLSADTANTASISGYVINDLDKDGQLDATDAGITGQVVWLDLDRDGIQDANEPANRTRSRGVFSFANLAAGAYVIREHLPAGYAFTGPAATAALEVTLSDGQASVGQIILNAAS